MNQYEKVKNAPTNWSQEFSQRKLSCLPQSNTAENSSKYYSLFHPYYAKNWQWQSLSEEPSQKPLKIEKLAPSGGSYLGLKLKQNNFVILFEYSFLTHST